MTNTIETEVVVIGSGPGGYSSAFRAADLGKKVVLIERYENLGGVCLNVGCIPSKALLHIAKSINEAADMGAHGIQFGQPNIEIDKVRGFKDSVIGKLTGGLKMMAKQRKVEVVNGTAKFKGTHELEIVNAAGETTSVKFQNAVIAVGSKPVKLPFLPEDPRIFDSTGALELANPTGKMLVLGGGIIGLEMATVYSALGAEVTIVEMQDQIIPGCDPDLVKPLEKRLGAKCEIMVNTKLLSVDAREDGLYAKFEGDKAPAEEVRFDQMLVAVGRVPNGGEIGAAEVGITVDERGFIPTDKQMKTNLEHVFAIGDVVGQPMLAHKAVPEGRLAAEVIAGKKHYFDAKCIPSVAYTDPEVAWVGLTETEAKRDGIKYEKGAFPWMASGRALAVDRSEGLTKVLFDPETHRVLGGGIVGVNAGDMISEIGLAIEMCCEAEDLALTIHPHPTFSESVMLATEMFEGTITDLYAPKKKKED